LDAPEYAAGGDNRGLVPYAFLSKPVVDSRKGMLSAPEAVQEANRWIARTESLVRRHVPRREAVPVAARPDADQEPGPQDAIVDSVNP